MTEEAQPQLREFETHDSAVPYVTLSHCWGSANIIRLEKANFESMGAGIDLQSLPKTFRDAILITRKFSFEYIWIDCLCIIQDSKEDWLHEAALMGEVYKNSRLNIAATGALDSNGGCFFDRKAALIRPTRVELDWAGKDGFSKREYFLIDSQPSLKSRLENARLNCRAWVLQERMLAPRVLHFARQQLFWECRELEACESYPSGLPKNRKGYSSHPKSTMFEDDLKNSTRTISDASNSPKKPSAFEHWAWIVEAYTRAELTVISDRLIALAGIAAQMQRVFNDDYLAGLWRRSFHHELLWIVKGVQSFRPDVYRAPSWSWISVEGAISYERCLQATEYEIVIYMAAVVDAQARAGSDNSSEIISGFVTICGKVGLTTWKQGRALYSSGTVIQLTDIREWKKESELEPLDADAAVYRASSVKFDVFNESTPPPLNLFCVPIVAIDEYFRRAQDWQIIYGLLLTQSQDGETFQRVGQFSISEEKGSQAFQTLPDQSITII
jgi:hypothetical protein